MREEIEKTLQVLKRGGIILYPTDTVWGIGCDATNASAVQKIYNLKQWTYYIRLDTKLRELLLHNLTLNYEKTIQKLQSVI